MNFSLIVSDTDTGSPPSPRLNHQPQRCVGGYSAQPWSSPAPTATNEFTTLVGGPPSPQPSLFQPPTSCYDSLVVFLPSPGPRPPQPPPTSRYDSLVVCSPQPCPSLFTTTTNESYSLVAPPWPWPSLFQPPTSRYDSLGVFLPSPGPRPPQLPPRSHNNSLVARSPQPRSSPAPTTTKES